MPNPSWQTTKDLVHRRANGCCEYCQTCEVNIGQALHIEHIDPTGNDDPDNLCLACPNCNLSKAAAIMALDPDSDTEVPLFNPRTQNWASHFKWIDNYAEIEGITATGRATVNHYQVKKSRKIVLRYLRREDFPGLWVSQAKFAAGGG